MNPELLEEVAYSLHKATTIRYSMGDGTPKWEWLDDRIKQTYLDRAEDLINTLGLEFEWAGEFNTHVGRIEQVYADEAFARVAVSEGQEDEPEKEWALIRRIVSAWENVI